MFVYITVNKINGKLYVGQTRRPESRSYLGGGKILQKALNKYSKHNFIRHILIRSNDQSVIDFHEKFYIQFFNTLNPNGYNLELGGYNGEVTDEIKEKHRQIKLGKKLSNAHKLKIKEARQHQVMDPMKDKTKNKISNTLKGCRFYTNGKYYVYCHPDNKPQDWIIVAACNIKKQQLIKL